MKKKLIISLFIVGIITVGGSFIAANNILPYTILQPTRKNVNITPETLSLNSFPLNITVDKNINLKGHWIQSNLEYKRAILILVHGVGGCKEHFLGLSKKLADIGIESIVFDSRAHGESGGQYCTYGYKEKEDISEIVDYIKSVNKNIPIGIWGNSMGGAIAIQALGIDKRIEFGIIESTFTALDEIVYDYQKRYLNGFGIPPVTSLALRRAGEIAGFNPDKVKPINSVKKIEQPVLIAHGNADKNISFEYGKALFDNLRSKNKTFIEIKGAGHFDLALKGGDSYKQKLLSFIEGSLAK